MNKTIQELLDEIQEANAEVGRWKNVVSELERQLKNVRINNLLQSEFLIKDWRYGKNDDGEYGIYRWLAKDTEDLRGLFSDSRSYVNLTPDIKLAHDEYRIIWLKGDFDKILDFIREYKLQVDFSWLEAEIESHQEEIELHREMLNKVKDKLNEH